MCLLLAASSLSVHFGEGEASFCASISGLVFSSAEELSNFVRTEGPRLLRLEEKAGLGQSVQARTQELVSASCLKVDRVSGKCGCVAGAKGRWH